jgi:hypothetical protein
MIFHRGSIPCINCVLLDASLAVHCTSGFDKEGSSSRGPREAQTCNRLSLEHSPICTIEVRVISIYLAPRLISFQPCLKRKSDNDSSNHAVAKHQCLATPPSTPERPSANSSIQHPLKRKLDEDSANHAVAKRQCLATPPSTPESPSVNSSIQHPLKRKLDEDSANHAVAKRQHVSTAQGVESVRSIV